MSRTKPSKSSTGPASRLLAVMVVALLLTAASCKTGTEDDNTSNVYVQILSMDAAAGEIGGGVGATVSVLLSDVCFANDDFPPCTVINDNGVVTMSAFAKDSTAAFSSVNNVVFERYRVTYIRADGRNVPGVDVPYPFDGSINFTLPANGSEVERGFVVVRHQAKRESPLREIAFNSSGILSVIAQIDFYGHDVAGRAVLVTGYLNITFADFTNE